MKNIQQYALTSMLLLLTACGGGGGGGDNGSSQGETVVTSTANSTSTAINVETQGSSLSIGGGVSQTEITIETTQSITLSWVPPAINSNGDPLDPSEIRGYEIYYSTEGSAANDGVLYVDLGTTTEVTIDNLAPGTYQFSIAAIENES